ncbi:MAG: phosphonate ABC transporter ATP-binding protein [Trueperaceae bacterium]|nr:phosphonate ABC transporter ATP-binding protein [Trueperaceae bacterium]
MLIIRDLYKRYGSGELVLQGLDLTVEQNALTAIIGSSGAGKSTLLRCVNRLVEPTSGSIELNGLEITGLRGVDLRRARRRIGMVFQAFNLLDRLTVMENVLAGRLGYVGFWRAYARRYPQSDVDRAYQLLTRVGLAQYVNTRADALSGGERQRVGVVRALMQNPEIILADEPTASLDPKTAEDIMRLLQELADELSLPVLINIHNVAQAKAYAARIVGLRFGRVIFDGRPAELDDTAFEQIYAGTLDEAEVTGQAPGTAQA